MIKKPTGDSFKLAVKQRVQNDNAGGEGYRECFKTCSTMLADYLLGGQLTDQAKHEGLTEPEDVFAAVLAKHGDTTDWGAEIAALEEFGIKAYSSRSASLNDVAHALYCGVPVIIGTAYKASGHIVLAVGRAANGFHILCPNGIRAGATNGWVERFYSEEDAKPDLFTWGLLKQVFTDLGAESGWALFVTSVNGEPTGVRSGL
jgi:Peptidase_C39 like family